MEFIDIYTVRWAPALAWVIFCAMIGIIFIFISITIFVASDSEKIGGVISITVLFVCFVLYSNALFSSVKIRYEVRIDDTVSLQEIVKDWDIIEQKDENIWVLERKNNKW